MVNNKIIYSDRDCGKTAEKQAIIEYNIKPEKSHSGLRESEANYIKKLAKQKKEKKEREIEAARLMEERQREYERQETQWRLEELEQRQNYLQSENSRLREKLNY